MGVIFEGLATTVEVKNETWAQAFRRLSDEWTRPQTALEFYLEAYVANLPRTGGSRHD